MREKAFIISTGTLAAIFATFLSFFQYHLFYILPLFASIDQAVWKLSLGQVPFVSFPPYVFQSLFSHHAEFIFFFVSFIYRFFPYPLVLFVIQHTVVFSGSIAFYLLLRRKNISPQVRFFAFLWYGAVYFWQQSIAPGVYSFDFTISCIMWLLYALELRSFPLIVSLTIMTLLTREESTVLLFFIFVIAFLKQRRRWFLFLNAFVICYGCFLYFYFFPIIMKGSFAFDIQQVITNSFAPPARFSLVFDEKRVKESSVLETFLTTHALEGSVAVQNNIASHLSHKQETTLIHLDMKQFLSKSPCMASLCPWLRFDGAPQYLLVDTSPVWNDGDVGVPEQELSEAIAAMITSGDIRVYIKQGNIIVYTIRSVLLGDGLVASYYPNRFLEGNASVIRVDPYINFHWIGQENFSVRWTGFILPEYSEPYAFYILRDDGVRLWINNSLVIDKWFDHAQTEYSAPIKLTKGVKVPIKIEYYQHLGKAVIQLGWASPSTPKEIIPQSQLFSY